MHNSDIDKLEPIGHARKVEAPPILKATTDAPHPKRKGHGKLIIFIICVVPLLAVAVFYALGHKTPPISVQTEKVVRRTITETVVANGKIYPVLQVPLSAEVSGEIMPS